jgi:CRP-like cAMP-binding protein
MKRTEIARIEDPALAGKLAETLCARGPLAGVGAGPLAEVIRRGTLIELDAGEALIREGEPATPEIYLLIEGALVVQSQGRTLARLDRPGDVVGEVAVVLSSKRTADVTAESAARAIAISARVLALEEFADVATGIRSTMLRDDWVQY